MWYIKKGGKKVSERKKNKYIYDKVKKKFNTREITLVVIINKLYSN